jgi:peptide/nickel transport system permease protein
MLVILFGSTFLVYNLSALSADPLEQLRLSTDPNAKQLIISLTRELQLDVPPPLRYFLWARGVLGIFTGNFTLGMTREGQPVLDTLGAAIPVTIRLVTLATILGIIVGITLGIVSALRQYSRFDYGMTFVAFLMYSLPIFWVAVLLKQYLAIGFNNFLINPNFSWQSLLAIGAASGVFWAALISGDRKRVWMIFLGVGAGTIAFIKGLEMLDWFLKPGFGSVGFFVISLLIALGVTQLSTGLQNRAAVKATVTMAVIGFALYYPINALWRDGISWLMLLGLAASIALVGAITGLVFAKVDRGPIVRTAMLGGFVMGLFMILDKLMRTWYWYMNTDAISGRPIPTIGQVNALLEFDPDATWWINTLDILVHLILPTIALMLISFAGYTRFARSTMLEVTNQDYIRTARAKGLNERTVIMRHAFRNTMIPLTTIMVADVAGIIGGAIITERVFGWTGMGTLVRIAIFNYDLNLLMGAALVTSTIAITANLVADLLYSALDPRIRVGSGK